MIKNINQAISDTKEKLDSVHMRVLLGERCKLEEIKFNLQEKKAAGKLDVAKEG